MCQGDRHQGTARPACHFKYLSALPVKAMVGNDAYQPQRFPFAWEWAWVVNTNSQLRKWRSRAPGKDLMPGSDRIGLASSMAAPPGTPTLNSDLLQFELGPIPSSPLSNIYRTTNLQQSEIDLGPYKISPVVIGTQTLHINPQ